MDYWKNRKVGVLALSAGISRESKMAPYIKEAIAWLEQRGATVNLGRTVWRTQKYRSATIATRVEDLMSMYESEEIDVILSVRGGFNSNEMLEYIDFGRIKAKPKWFVGYSDITALNLALHAKAKAKVMHGAMLGDFKRWPDCLDVLGKTLFEREAASKKKKALKGKLKTLSGKRVTASGRLIAVNLSTFSLLLGTKYMPDLTGTFIFVEYDKEEQHGLPSLQRFMWQLRQAGVFEKVNGLVFGKLEESVGDEEVQGFGLKEILTEVTSGYKFPVIYNAPFGHATSSWQLPFSAMVRKDKDGLWIY